MATTALINAGSLDKRVTLQSRDVARDATGGIDYQWADFQTVWASIEPARAIRSFGAAQEQEAHDNLIKIRYLPGVRTTMRVLWMTPEGSAKTYEVLGVRLERESRRGFLYLQCVERQEDGWRKG